MINFLSTRELAVATWVVIMVLFLCIKYSATKAFVNLVRACCNRVFIVHFTGVLVYGLIVIFACSQFLGWESIYLKDMLLWLTFVGSPVCFKAANRKLNESYFKEIVLDNIRGTVFVEFLISNITFSYAVELLLQPFLVGLASLDKMAGSGKEWKLVENFLDSVIVIVGVAFLGIGLHRAINGFLLEEAYEAIVSFCIPIFLSIVYLPYAYFRAIKYQYLELFSRVKVRHFGEEKDLKRKKHEIIRLCGLSFRKIKTANKAYYAYISKVKSMYDKEDLMKYIKERLEKLTLHIFCYLPETSKLY